MNNNEIAIRFREQVLDLEANLKSVADGVNIVAGTKDKPIVNDSELIPIEHYFMDGVYIRKMTMKEGVAVVGAIHKHLHMCFLTEGHVTVANEEEVVDYIAPCIIISTPGIKRVLLANEDSVWYNIHQNPTNTQDVDKIERNTVAISYEEYENYIKNK